MRVYSLELVVSVVAAIAITAPIAIIATIAIIAAIAVKVIAAFRAVSFAWPFAIPHIDDGRKSHLVSHLPPRLARI